MGKQQFNVVVLDSEPIVLATIAIYLSDAGHHVQVGQSSLDQLDHLRSCLKNADVVMVDANPHSPEDIEIIELIKARYPKAWLVVMQGSGFNVHMGDITSNSPTTILQKPIRLSELETLLLRFEEHKQVILPKLTGPIPIQNGGEL